MKVIKDRNGTETVWYILYLIANVFTFASFWFMRNLITFAVREAFKEDE